MHRPRRVRDQTFPPGGACTAGAGRPSSLRASFPLVPFVPETSAGQETRRFHLVVPAPLGQADHLPSGLRFLWCLLCQKPEPVRDRRYLLVVPAPLGQAKQPRKTRKTRKGKTHRSSRFPCIQCVPWFIPLRQQPCLCGERSATSEPAGDRRYMGGRTGAGRRPARPIGPREAFGLIRRFSAAFCCRPTLQTRRMEPCLTATFHPPYGCFRKNTPKNALFFESDTHLAQCLQAPDGSSVT